MGNQSDRLTAGIRPILDKTLENAVAHRIAKEFPCQGSGKTSHTDRVQNQPL